MWRVLIAAAVAVCMAGCASGPLLENPLPIRPDRPVPHENPLYVPQGEQAYACASSTRSSTCFPTTSPWPTPAATTAASRPPPSRRASNSRGSPAAPTVTSASFLFQTIRHRAVVVITTAEDGGYFIDLKVYKELQDLPRPSRATAGDATCIEQTVQRQFEVVEPELFESSWIPHRPRLQAGQCILDRLSHLDCSEPPR